MSPPWATTSSRFWVDWAWAGRARGLTAAAAPAAAAPCRSVRLETFMVVPSTWPVQARFGLVSQRVNADGSGRVPAVEIASSYRASAPFCQAGRALDPRGGHLSTRGPWHNAGVAGIASSGMHRAGRAARLASDRLAALDPGGD